MNRIYSIYKTLYDFYGPQGWWPLTSCKEENISKAGANKGYHVLDYSYPKNNDERFEICLGSILTQNTTWISVEKSLNNLKKINCLNPQSILDLEIDDLKKTIRPSGYFNQKSDYIRGFIRFFLNLNKHSRIPSRQELLSIKGIGPETADSMLLYAFKQPVFVVDTYTKRIFKTMGLISEKTNYTEVKNLAEKNLKGVIKNKDELVIVYQEYHALLVEHAKRYYSKKPYAQGCPLLFKFKPKVIVHLL